MESEEDVPEDEWDSDTTSPQLLPNVENLGTVILCCELVFNTQLTDL